MGDIFDIDKVVEILKKEYKRWDVPVVTLISLQSKDPFKVLLSTIISLRTKDEVTIEASRRLFEVLKKPEDINNLGLGDIEERIYPCGFYRRKAAVIEKACKRIVEEHNSKVPKDIDELLEFEGIGRKSANLILAEGYGIPAICVDTHVHRISNRFGYIDTKTALQSEEALREVLPKRYWIIYNTLLVALGQKICRPISPFCSRCPVKRYCKRVEVYKSR